MQKPDEIHEKSMEQEHEVQEGKFFAIISYISFLCIITLILKKDNKFAVYHAKHGLVLFVAEIVAFILSVIPFLGPIIQALGILIFTLVSVWGILQCLRGAYSRIPVVSEIADKIVL